MKFHIEVWSKVLNEHKIFIEEEFDDQDYKTHGWCGSRSAWLKIMDLLNLNFPNKKTEDGKWVEWNWKVFQIIPLENGENDLKFTFDKIYDR